MKDGHTLEVESIPDHKWALFSMTCPSQKACWIAGEKHMIWKFEGTDDDVIDDVTIPAGDDAPGSDLAGLEGLSALPDAAAAEGLTNGDGQAVNDGSGSSGGSSDCSFGGVAVGFPGLLLLLPLIGLAVRRS